MKHSIKTTIIGVAFVILSPGVWAELPPIIDTHIHLNNGVGPRNQIDLPSRPDFEGAVDAAIVRMDRFGIRRSLLMPPPMPPAARAAYDIEALQFAVKKYPDRIFLLGGGGSLNALIQGTSADAVTEDIKQRFRARAEQIAASGAVAFGEIASHHLSLRRMGPQHAYEWSPPDHPLLLLLADLAAEKGMPIDLHLDLVPEDMERPDRPVFNPATPSHLKANLAGFERLLNHNRNARIIWAHAGTDPLGTRTPQIERALLTRHPNLYMSLRVGVGGTRPFVALDETLTLKPEWLALLQDFPDRFVLGSDFFHGAGGNIQRGPSEDGLENYGALLRQMPPDLADAIAHRNAENIFRMPPLMQGKPVESGSVSGTAKLGAALR